MIYKAPWLSALDSIGSGVYGMGLRRGEVGMPRLRGLIDAPHSHPFRALCPHPSSERLCCSESKIPISERLSLRRGLGLIYRTVANALTWKMTTLGVGGRCPIRPEMVAMNCSRAAGRAAGALSSASCDLRENDW